MNKLSEIRKLYVLSKPFDGKRRLIGELLENDGEYTFKYKLGGKFPEWFLQLEFFSNPQKIYTGAEVRPFVESIVPDRNLWCISAALKAAGLTEYDEWGFLKYSGAINPSDDVFLFEEIPENTVIYGEW
jgi:hypothetical protein